MEKNFFKFDNAVDFHFYFMNIVMLIRERYEEEGYDCYCDKYRNCCCFPLVKRCFRQRRPRFCTMCKLQSFCYKENAIDNMSVREFLDRNSEDSQKLNELAKLLWPFFKKIFLQTDGASNFLMTSIAGALDTGTLLRLHHCL